MTQPEIKKGDKVQLLTCPKYPSIETHTARVTGEWSLYKDGWRAPVRFNCMGIQTAVVNYNNMILIKKGLRNMGPNTPWYATSKAINLFIGLGVAIALFLMVMGFAGSVINTYVGKDQQVATAQSNISKEEQRRVDLFNNLVDAVESAKNFEGDTQTQIAQARSQANGGHVDSAMLTLNRVTEAYPEIKSIDLYKQTMLEFSATENRLAQYRESYNTDVKDFNSYVQGFPNSFFLQVFGKSTAPKQYLDFNVDNSQARDLFNK